ATALFALANVIINYHLALGNRTGSLLALVAGSAQVLVLVLYHATLYQVVMLQIVLMAGLLFALLSWDLIILHRAQKSPTEIHAAREAHGGGSKLMEVSSEGKCNDSAVVERETPSRK
ncbi:MAG: hypothetical protein KDE58_04305, partial [Caldilineaceae bacterium]|nr:hypothetical protein [Caldilineaceae bacterium]